MSEAKAVVDSSGWIEVFSNGPLAKRFIAVLDAEAALVVPAIQAVAVMQRGLVVDLDSRLAIAAAQLSSAMHCDFQGINDVELLCRS